MKLSNAQKSALTSYIRSVVAADNPAAIGWEVKNGVVIVPPPPPEPDPVD